jgi:hypothetical protein
MEATLAQQLMRDATAMDTVGHLDVLVIDYDMI